MGMDDIERDRHLADRQDRVEVDRRMGYMARMLLALSPTPTSCCSPPPNLDQDGGEWYLKYSRVKKRDLRD